MTTTTHDHAEDRFREALVRQFGSKATEARYRIDMHKLYDHETALACAEFHDACAAYHRPSCPRWANYHAEAAERMRAWGATRGWRMVRPHGSAC